jgi:hypothetical protein
MKEEIAMNRNAARYTINVHRNEDGSIDYDFYKAQARTKRNETRTRVFRRMFAFLLGKRAPLPGKTRTRIACVSY